MISENSQKILHGFCYVGTGGAVCGAISNDQLFTWSAVAVAISSAFITAGLAGYHRLREAARQENVADRAADLESIRVMARVQIEIESRVNIIEEKANKVIERIGLIEAKAKILGIVVEDAAAKLSSQNSPGEAPCGQNTGSG